MWLVIKNRYQALINSIAGLKHAILKEETFRQEFILFLVAVPLAFLLTLDPWRLTALLGSLILMMCVELLNTAIEALCDLVSPEYNDYVKIAKDCGLAAVLMTMVIAAAVWLIVLYEFFFTLAN
jgi:diacylglycerol kinase (ATP)